MRYFVVVLSMWSVPVLADVAPPAPEDLQCPRGAKGAGNGVSVWCEPTTCANDVSCGDGYRCSEEDIGVCVEPIEVATERFRPSLDPDTPPPAVPTTTVRSVRSRGCEPNGTCLNVDSTCEHARRCVRVEEEPDVPSAVLSATPAEPVEAATDTEAASGCACRTSEVPGGALLFMLLLASRGPRLRGA